MRSWYLSYRREVEDQATVCLPLWCDSPLINDYILEINLTKYEEKNEISFDHFKGTYFMKVCVGRSISMVKLLQSMSMYAGVLILSFRQKCCLHVIVRFISCSLICNMTSFRNKCFYLLAHPRGRVCECVC